MFHLSSYAVKESNSVFSEENFFVNTVVIGGSDVWLQEWSDDCFTGGQMPAVPGNSERLHKRH